MARKKKNSGIFAKGFCPYGTYVGSRWNADQWCAAFHGALSEEQVEQIVGKDSPWAILGIGHGSSVSDVKQAYRAAAQKWHPDKHRGEEAKAGAAKQFIRIKAAYI